MSKKDPPAVKPATPAERKPVEDLKSQSATPDWLFAAAKQKHRWAVGHELTASEYKAAIEAAGNEVIG